jgi:hypothetical protein
MQFLKGLAIVSGTVLALLIATILCLFLVTRRGPEPPPGTAVGWDLKLLWILTIHSPIYWLVAVTWLGLSARVFWRWVLIHQ